MLACLRHRTVRRTDDQDRTVLFGNISRSDITSRLHDWDRDYFEYEPDEETVAALSDAMLDVEIKIILGTWCGDSRREIPRLWKILEQIGYPVDEVEMFGVGSSRFTAKMGISREILDWSDAVKKYYEVERVATFIFYRGGRELGRIEENRKVLWKKKSERSPPDEF